ncbi:MAG: ABC transporter ATP-binding protein [Patescibacteria group bacterium]
MSALQIQNLSKVYKNGVKALNGASLTVEEGDFFALLGANGAGKTTMIGIITGLVNKTDGEVKIFGFDHLQDASKAKTMIGVVPQEFNFNQFEKVWDIVITQAGYYGITAAEAAPNAEKLLKQLGLWEKKDKQAMTLSGGMKRRLMIARALVHQPKLIILDEPTAGVDIELRREMWEYLTELNKSGVTIILTTHYLEEAELLCRNVAIIDKGQIVTQGPIRELIKTLDTESYLLDVQKTPKIDSIQDYALKTTENEHVLEAELKRGQDLNGLIAQLTGQGVSVTGIRPKENRLEELFLKVLAK